MTEEGIPHFTSSTIKWSKLRCNSRDIVLLKTEVNDPDHWPVARVISCETDKNGMVRAVKLRVCKSKILLRPVNKMVLLLENETTQFPDKGSHVHTKF